MELMSRLNWNLEHIWSYFLQMLPCMCLALPIWSCVRPQRYRRLARMGLYSPPSREHALLLFTLFCAGLAALTLFPANFWSVDRWVAAARGERPLFPSVNRDLQRNTLQLIPFSEIRRGLYGGWVLFLVIANIGIFLPVGFFAALLWRRPRWYRSLLAGLCSSCTIEFIQFFIGRSSDIDDVLLNTAGSLMGFWLFLLLRALFPRFISRFQCEERTDP